MTQVLSGYLGGMPFVVEATRPAFPGAVVMPGVATKAPKPIPPSPSPKPPMNEERAPESPAPEAPAASPPPPEVPSSPATPDAVSPSLDIPAPSPKLPTSPAPLSPAPTPITGRKLRGSGGGSISTRSGAAARRSLLADGAGACPADTQGVCRSASHIISSSIAECTSEGGR